MHPNTNIGYFWRLGLQVVVLFCLSGLPNVSSVNTNKVCKAKNINVCKKLKTFESFAKYI